MDVSYPGMGQFDPIGPMGKPMPGQPQRMGLMPMQALQEIVNALTRGLGDLSLQCAAASMARYIPEARNLPGLGALHKANYEAAYHLTSALGAAGMIQMGAREPQYYAVLVHCERKTLEALQRAQAAFQQLSQATPPALRPWAQRIGGLLQATTGHVQRAVSITSAALGQQGMQRVMQLIEQAGEG
jgi:hypothetical protein